MDGNYCFLLLFIVLISKGGEIYDKYRSHVYYAICSYCWCKACSSYIAIKYVFRHIDFYIQAATQIHEQTITFVPKLILIIALCLFSGNWMLETLQDYTFQLFQMMLL